TGANQTHETRPAMMPQASAIRQKKPQIALVLIVRKLRLCTGASADEGDVAHTMLLPTYPQQLYEHRACKHMAAQSCTTCRQGMAQTNTPRGNRIRLNRTLFARARTAWTFLHSMASASWTCIT